MPVPRVSRAVGRLFAWQSRHSDGCWAAESEAWYRATSPPSALFVDHVAATSSVGARWHSEQSFETSACVPGALFTHATASCRISGEAGERTGEVATGPTKPWGIA